tara:strand:- start:560 stop:934 length:375 start_codon:yes stop_codon:yes gene_type:complete
MNIFSFTGNIGKDAELRNTNSGTAILNFAVPVKSGYGERESTTWVNCSLFGKRAESLQRYLVKGTPVAVNGELSLRKYPKNDGSEGTSLEVNVNDVTMMGRAQGDNQTPAPDNRDDLDGDLVPF